MSNELPPKTRVMFLDIDGVVCTHRTMCTDHTYKWDEVGLNMINHLCEKYDFHIVLSSTWRVPKGSSHMLYSHGIHRVHQDDSTPQLWSGCRGAEINRWLEDHPEVTHYVIVDDDADMLDEQKPYFVQTCGLNGILIEHFEEMRRIMRNANPMVERSFGGENEHTSS